MDFNILEWAMKLAQMGYENISIILLVGSSLYLFHKYMAKPFGRFIMNGIQLWKRLETSIELVEKIHSEMYPNGGDSLRDAINRIEEKVHFIEEKDKAMFTTMTDKGYFETDADGLVTWVSKAWCNMTGMVPHEARGHGWVGVLHDEDKAYVFDEWMESINQEREHDTAFRFVNMQTKDIIKVHGHSIPIKNSKNKLVGVLGVVEIVDVEKADDNKV